MLPRPVSAVYAADTLPLEPRPSEGANPQGGLFREAAPGTPCPMEGPDQPGVQGEASDTHPSLRMRPLKERDHHAQHHSSLPPARGPGTSRGMTWLDMAPAGYGTSLPPAPRSEHGHAWSPSTVFTAVAKEGILNPNLGVLDRGPQSLLARVTLETEEGLGVSSWLRGPGPTPGWGEGRAWGRTLAGAKEQSPVAM